MQRWREKYEKKKHQRYIRAKVKSGEIQMSNLSAADFGSLGGFKRADLKSHNIKVGGGLCPYCMSESVI